MKKVFCWGTFDLLHEGHIAFLQDARNKGDYFTIIVISDNAVYENKRKKTIDNQNRRATNLRATGIVDKVIEASDDLNVNLERIASLKPDVFVFGYDQQTSIETQLMNYLANKGLSTEYYSSNEFANGIHTSQIRKMPSTN